MNEPDTGVVQENSPNSIEPTPTDAVPADSGEWKAGDPLDKHPRFSEVIEQRNEARSQVEQANQNFQQAAQRADQTAEANLRLQDALRESMNQPAPTANGRTNGEWENDPQLRGMRAKFEEGPAGDAAFRDLVDLIDTRSKANVPEPQAGVTPEQVQEAVNAGVGRVTATMQTQQAIGDMVSKGMLDTESAAEMATRMKTYVDGQPAWGEAANQPMLVDKVYMDMLRDGKVKPGAKPRNNPLQPGGSRPPSSEQRAKDHDSFLLDMKNDPRFKNTLGRMSIEQLRKDIPPDNRSGDVVSTPRGDVDSRVLKDSYVHVRGDNG